QFSWIASLEDNWQAIRQEFLSLDKSQTDFTPYVGDGPDVPVSMQNLAGSHDWDAFHLYVGGKVQTANAAACPVTAKLLETLPMARLAGVAPEAFFSVLRPGAHIKPHHGISNVKVAVHLPLVVPDQCAIRVGEEWRSWQDGRCLIFDDSFEHEAYNRSSHVRVVLIFEVWHPDISETEAQAMTALSSCIDTWSAGAKQNLQARL
ncbi:MAG: aspartyl/asparaginyl beta-hydroxylase domain-containing protein, partial [Gammaproteobacteria bacterium]|nr:aspartyl/asparaginyl beta-hydroxylase domain-containing protein [Gammaproteobacteria bacterium]